MIMDSPYVKLYYEYRLYHSKIEGRATFNGKDLYMFLKKAKLLDFNFDETILMVNQRTGRSFHTTLQTLQDDGL